jgi:hypothetical protein
VLGLAPQLRAYRAPPALPTPDKPGLQLAVIDARFAAGHVFAAGMHERSVPVADYLGDVTGVWYERLDPVWRHVPVAVGGLTTAGALFCLEHLARDHGLRVIYRGIHEHLPQGGTQHFLESDAALGQPSPSKPGLWPVHIANLMVELSNSVAGLPGQKQNRQRIGYRTEGAGTEGVDGHQLASWLIVPHASRA